jgi:predicted AAA+ superfamily ATPase
MFPVVAIVGSRQCGKSTLVSDWIFFFCNHLTSPGSLQANLSIARIFLFKIFYISGG